MLGPLLDEQPSCLFLTLEVEVTGAQKRELTQVGMQAVEPHCCGKSFEETSTFRWWRLLLLLLFVLKLFSCFGRVLLKKMFCLELSSDGGKRGRERAQKLTLLYRREANVLPKDTAIVHRVKNEHSVWQSRTKALFRNDYVTMSEQERHKVPAKVLGWRPCQKFTCTRKVTNDREHAYSCDLSISTKSPSPVGQRQGCS
jgi:hypothetical protein